MVLGFNSADKRQIALDLLKKKSLSFPNVLDSSMEARLTTMQEYRISAVPITYVIDREGKVVEAWVGSQAGIPRAAKLLEKLGIE